MTTVANLIQRALLDIREIGEDQEPSARQTSDGLFYFNDLVQSWANDGLMIQAYSATLCSASGASSYTLGNGGTWQSDLNISQIDAMYYVLDNITYLVPYVSPQEYFSSPDIITATGQPDRYTVIYNFSANLHNVYFYPKPSTGTFTALCTRELSAGLVATDVLDFPTGYERAFRLALGVDLMPQYGKSDPVLINLADKAKKDIMRLNATRRPVVMGLGLPTYGQRSNILVG